MEKAGTVPRRSDISLTILNLKCEFETEHVIHPRRVRIGKHISRWLRSYVKNKTGMKVDSVDGMQIYDMEIKTDFRLKPCEVVVTDER